MIGWNIQCIYIYSVKVQKEKGKSVGVNDLLNTETSMEAQKQKQKKGSNTLAVGPSFLNAYQLLWWELVKLLVRARLYELVNN